MKPKGNSFKKGERNSKGQKSNTSRKFRGNRSDSSDATVQRKDLPVGCSLNDLSWYTRYPDLLSAAARIPFPNKPGMIVSGLTTYQDITPKINVPGIMTLWYAPSIGRSVDVQSPATIMSKELWSRIRSKFSSSLDADPPDVIMYALALDQLHAYMAWLKRVYRTLNTWSPQNHDFPDAMLYAMGFNASNVSLLLDNLPNFYGRINTMIRKVNKFYVPDDMDIFKRHSWMNEHVYGDEDSPLAQMYIFNPLYYWVVDGTSATKLTTYVIPNFLAASSYEDLITRVFVPANRMLNALSSWEDAYVINGYIERAFVGTQFYGTDLLGYDERLRPVYAPEVLSQIENAKSVGVADPSSYDVTQDPTTNAILHTPRGYSSVDPNIFINLHIDNPTAADVTIATRLTGIVGNFGGQYTDEVVCGTEAILDITYTGYAKVNNDSLSNYTIYSGTGVTKGIYGDYLGYNSYWSVPTPTSLVENLSAISAWRHHPILMCYIKDTVDSAFKAYPFMDMHNLTCVDYQTLANLHTVCVYSEFNCFRENH